MQSLLQVFSIHNVLFSVHSYQVSYIELLRTLLSLWAYIEIIRRKSRGLIISMLGCLVLVFLFHQVQLYSGMVLMIYYIIASAIALVFWQRNKKKNHADLIKATRLHPRNRIILPAPMPIARYPTTDIPTWPTHLRYHRRKAPASLGPCEFLH